jgi:ATP adenylyltransferase
MLDGPMESSTISYNLGLTDRSMVLIPRRMEGSMISAGDREPCNIGPIALNGTVLAGTLLVKNEMEWNALKHDPSQFSRLLEVIGIPSPDFANEKL